MGTPSASIFKNGRGGYGILSLEASKTTTAAANSEVPAMKTLFLLE